MNNWLEVSLTVDGELAEAVAEVLSRFAPNGVVIERGVEFTSPDDEGTPVGPMQVRAYLPEDGRLGETRRRVEEALWFLGRIRPLPEPVFTQVVDQNWMEAWKHRYRPIPVGGKLIIVPVWMESPDSSRIPVRIDPGMAFGTGTHPTTQLCLELLERWVIPGEAVIDIGSGSGILSVAALKLGASQALGVDIDAEAFKAARDNAESNGVSDQLILGVGSVPDVRDGQFAISKAPLVLANILANVLIRLLNDGLAELIAPGGVLIMSGILADQADDVITTASGCGLELVEKIQMDDWVALVVK